MLGHNYIGTEHLLLGLLRDRDGIAARVLESFEVGVDEVRAQVESRVGRGEESTSGQIPFTPRAKKVLELALKEASSLGQRNVVAEHILLGLLREGEGVANQILDWYGATADKVRNEVLQSLPAVPAARHGSERAFTTVRTGIGLWALAAALSFAVGLGILLGWLI